MTKQHAIEWLQNRIDSNPPSAFGVEVTEEDADSFIKEYNRPDIPPQPPLNTVLGDKNHPGFVWVHILQDIWACSGDGLKFNWSQAYVKGADPTKVLVDRQTLIDKLLPPQSNSNEIFLDRLALVQAIAYSAGTELHVAQSVIRSIRKRAGVKP